MDLIALITALIAISIAIRTATARIAKLRIRLAYLFPPLGHGQLQLSLYTRLQPSLHGSRYPKVTTSHRTRHNQNFSKHVNPSLATAAIVAVALTLIAVSCGATHPTTQTSSTPPGTYILTLTSTAPPASSPPTLSLTLTVQ